MTARLCESLPDAAVIRGVVQHGDERGRELGFPTANLPVDGSSGGGSLEDGVWAGWLVRADGSTFASAISIGGRPTFYGREGFRLVEAHLLDFSGDLYGEEVELTVCHKIRRQRRFPSPEALVTRLHRDVSDCRVWAAGQVLRPRAGRRPVDPGCS